METTGRTRPWWRRPLFIDVAVVVALAAVLVILVTVASEPGAQEADALAYVVVVLLALTQLFRRQQPVVSLLISVILVFAYQAMKHSGMKGTVTVVDA